MTERVAILLGVAVAGAVAMLLYNVWRQRGSGPERLDVQSFALDVMATPYAFIVFTSPSCRPCKTALRVVREAADRSGGTIEVQTVDSLERQDLATACNVRSLPTVFLVTASGRVLHRWTEVPPRDEISTYLRAA